MSQEKKEIEDAILALDLDSIGKFPLLNEPCGDEKCDIYSSDGKFPDDFCGGAGHNVAPVYNFKNLVVSECKCAETIKDALNLLYRLKCQITKEQRLMRLPYKYSVAWDFKPPSSSNDLSWFDIEEGKFVPFTSHGAMLQYALGCMGVAQDDIKAIKERFPERKWNTRDINRIKTGYFWQGKSVQEILEELGNG